MKENPLIAAARELATGSTRYLDLPTLERVHGPKTLRDFLKGWQRWRAIDKRRAVLFGHSDNRHKTAGGQRGTVGADDMEETFLRWRYAHGEGWPRPAEVRAAEVNEWLAHEATNEQRALFLALGRDGRAMEPADKPLAALLVHFLLLLERLGRLPTRDELRRAYYARHAKLSARERQAFKRNLKALGLEALPDGTLAAPLPEPDGREPFDELTRGT